MREEIKCVVVRFEHGAYEWMAEHSWQAHLRAVPNSKGQVVSNPLPIQDAINLCQLANNQQSIET
jgi:hypothetical protein